MFLIRQTSNLKNIHTGVLHGSMMGPLLLLIYISDLTESLSSNSKLSADNTSIFSVVHDLNTTVSEINASLNMIDAWAHHWKMSFNPDSLKQVQEINPVILILFSTVIQ